MPEIIFIEFFSGYSWRAYLVPFIIAGLELCIIILNIPPPQLHHIGDQASRTWNFRGQKNSQIIPVFETLKILSTLDSCIWDTDYMSMHQSTKRIKKVKYPGHKIHGGTNCQLHANTATALVWSWSTCHLQFVLLLHPYNTLALPYKFLLGMPKGQHPESSLPGSFLKVVLVVGNLER
jgi:hypothetical protein